MTLARLPIDDVLPELCQSLRRHPALVLKAPTGAGKTTRVPPAILAAGIAADRQVLLLQPRRIAARAAAARIAQERHWTLGSEVGYHVRFERRVGPRTQIVAMTNGVFTRLLQDDPFIERAGVVIFDEFHERNLEADLSLAMVRRAQRELRPDLKIVVMSATLEMSSLVEYFDGCPAIESQGRSFPVEIRYQKFAESDPIWMQAACGVADIVAERAGDVLVFLPGVQEIRRTRDQLADLAERLDLQLMELYGDLPLEKQQAVLERSPRRKIVLATNVAETSLTIDGVTSVVDTGLARVLRRDPAHGLNRLEIERISRASADQRAGRAGRTGPGVCLRLWTEREQHGLAERDDAEILRVDLAELVLGLAAWGETDWRLLPWFESPPQDAIELATRELQSLGALDGQRLTPLGQQMARLFAHPRIARLLIAGVESGCAPRAALAAALLSEREPFARQPRDRRGGHGRHSDSDLVDRVAALEAFESTGNCDSPVGRLNAASARWILRCRDQLLRALDDAASISARSQSPQSVEEATPLLHAIFTAFADRIARRRAPGSRRAALVGGRGVRLADESGLAEGELFAAVEIIEAGQSESLVRQASIVEREWLDPRLIATATEVEFDATRERVIAWRRTRYLDLVIDEAVTGVPAEFDLSELLAREASARFEFASLVDEDERQFIERVRSLAEWMPELELPRWDAESLRGILPRLCVGCRSLDELRKSPKLGLLKNLLSPVQLAAVERHAPSRIQVPSGSAIRLQYEAGKPPVLAVRIQEVFGLAETPRVAAGRVAVVMSLLGPNYRPQQVTSDLGSFWRTTYSEVRKELRRRYPKHSWPEDPTSAPAVSRPGRRPPKP